MIICVEKKMNRRIAIQSLIFSGPIAQIWFAKHSFAQSQKKYEPLECVNLSTLFDQLFADGKGFETGDLSQPSLAVYVIFDPQCPDCISFWKLANKFSKKILFIWIPVAILNSRSEPQGAILLSSPNPVQTMNRQVMLFNMASRGIETDSISISNDAREDVWRNSRIFRRAGGKNVPFAMYQDRQNEIAGSIDIDTPEALTKFLKINI